MATFNAFFEISTIVTFDNGNSFFKVIPIQPEPVPISNIEISFLFNNFKVFSINSSVSNLGIKTFLFTLKV